ncbi:MAG TPA: hypothetical protein VD962_07205 [Rubricoccaceae bacterium]|nr:hypothetical protein [Rubricoccaceae bacterium]
MNTSSTPRRAALSVALLSVFALVRAAGAQPSDHTDPRVGLRAGFQDAEEAALNLALVAHVPKPEGFYNPDDIGDFSMMNADLAFSGNTLFLGGFQGLQVYDISDPTRPRLRTTLPCPGGQGDVSVHGDLLFMSVEETRGRLDCGPGGVPEPVSAERFRGVRIFDVTDVEHPRQVAAVQTCRGSHTHTLVPDPDDPSHVYIYVSGTSGVRPAEELAGCSEAGPEDPNTSLFRIEVIEVPLAHPERAAIVNAPSFLLGLAAPREHGETTEDLAFSLGLERVTPEEAAAARARGAFVVTMEGADYVMDDETVPLALAQTMEMRGVSEQTPTAEDSTALRSMLQEYVTERLGTQGGEEGRPGPDQCHDITVYPEIGLAGGACSGYGILLDISDPTNPRRIAQAADENFAYWHSATFSNDGTKVIFTDEWGGGMAPRCRATDRREWGANALFTIEDRQLAFQGYYKLPAPQSDVENCVAHNGSIIPIPGRDIMVQAWYQGGVSVFDFTDPSNPVEIAYFDRGPMDAEQLAMSGYWSAYWYNGHIYASEIGRGLDVFRLTPSEHLSADEIAAAEAVRMDVFNPQTQTRVTW